MKFITERPINYDLLNNLELRSKFEDEEIEPMMFTHLKTEGYVGNRPLVFEGEHEDDTWAIDQYDEDEGQVINSFLYSSYFEYQQDCYFLGLSVFQPISTTEFNSFTDAGLTDTDTFAEICDKLDQEDISHFYISLDDEDVLEAVENEKEIADLLDLRYYTIEPQGIFIAIY